MRKVAVFMLSLVGLFALGGLALADDAGRTFSIALTGAAERPGPGDPDGTGTATLRLNPGQEEICYELTVEGITLPATLAHIHRGPAGVAGPPVVDLIPPDASGSSSGCASGESVTRELIVHIIQNPEQYYVNVHTTDFGAGAVRGQLSP